MEAPMDALSAPPPDFTVVPESSQRGVAAAAATHAGHSEVQPLDVRIVPLLFVVTYWCGLMLVYAFMAYVIAMSATWRGPVIVWALLIPTAAFSLWRRLPSERRFVETKSAEVILLRCGGFYALAGSDSSCGHADEMPEAQRHHRQLPHPVR
ncbi:hypothetical protein CGC20_13070 [Leishmania donovani]|uniref:Uncharacterized protein n=1 Tax=Leishmania donovani TaxID=5661 RepID=A0A504XYV9_LEIDO|nr:hypothetical protein CGC20_13070 [Leishmania donovani]TPP54342.1 hypothetical protein CGC21_22505 [Leishmania donovani]